MMADTPLEKVETLAAHEMVHVFMGGLDPQSWYEEGLAVLYQHRAPFMTGLIDEDAYIADINEMARTYYRNVRFDMPMKEAEESFWTDARARLQPYVRSGLYFSLVDAKLKAATSGKRNLDSVMREFIASRNAGKSVTVADWLTLIARDLGPAAGADYQAMLTGKKIFLPANAFGPCFQQVKERVPVFELGFDSVSLMKSPRIIQNLDPASPAAKAGLKDGDKVVWNTSQDTAQEAYGEDMVLKVERDGKTVEIRFLPHGALTDSYQWKRVAKGAQCRV
jgi:predicted metalloprotease with PDZ domain